MGQPGCLYIVIPCYNEENVLPVTAPIFLEELENMIEQGKVSEFSRIVFIDDGSKDRTWEIIKELNSFSSYFQGIQQSRNRGHQNAVLAGMLESREKCDMVISIDCDGQDDILTMEKMVDAYYDGAEIVYGVRSDRSTDSFFKRNTAETYYKILEKMGVEVIYNHADYRLVSSKVLDAFKDFKEVNLYLRGMFPLVGFKSTCVYYERHERMGGKSHYPLSKMMSLAFDGITSLSIKPIRLISSMGVIVSMLSLIGVIWAIVDQLMGNTVTGWASTVCVICFVSGIQLISLGVIGEYIGKIYLEVKARPRYIISERTMDDKRKYDE